MEFPGPDSADLAQVESLNRAFLDHLAAAGKSLLGALPPAVAAAMVEAAPVARARLARSPFLLFSLGELDEPAWARVLEGGGEADLIESVTRPGAAEARIATAAVAFLWQFANRNGYAARVVSGAPDSWCARIADCRLLDLIEFASNRAGLLRLRFAENGNFWRRLAIAGTSDEIAVRQAARVTALQAVLTCSALAGPARLPAAACTMPAPALRVAERSSVSQNRTRRYNTPPHEGSVASTTRKNLSKR